MKTIPTLLCACLALTAVAQAQTTTPPVPQYYIAEIIQPPADPPATANYVFNIHNLNSQNYALFLYDPDHNRPTGSDTYVIGVYTGQGRYIVLAQPANYTQVDVNNLSDTATDGSFYVCGSGKTGNFTRAIVWHVSGNGTPGAPLVLQNYVRPPENTSPGEEGYGSAAAVNSQGLVVGTYRWQAPNPTAIRFSDGYPAQDVDEQGNYLRNVGYGNYVVELNGTTPIPTSAVSSSGEVLRNGRAAGYQDDSSGNRYGFVYPFGASSAMQLPDYPKRPDRNNATTVTALSADGDILGDSEAAAYKGGSSAVAPFAVLWKLQPDGSYQVNQVSEIIAAINGKKLPFGSHGDPAYVRALGLGGDSTILLGNFNGQGLNSPSALIRPGDPRPVITSAHVVAARVGQPFSFQLTATNHPTSFAYFNQVDSFPQSLPDGLVLDNQTGIISGTPTTAGYFDLYVHALNGQGDASVNESFLRFIVTNAPAAFFEAQTALSNGVYYLRTDNPFYGTSSVFGYYSYLSDPHFIYHFDLGYEYWIDALDPVRGIYFYDFKSNGFFYTSPNFPFPYMYDFALNTVVYYYPDSNNEGRYNTNGIRYFYRFDTGEIFSK